MKKTLLAFLSLCLIGCNQPPQQFTSSVSSDIVNGQVSQITVKWNSNPIYLNNHAEGKLFIEQLKSIVSEVSEAVEKMPVENKENK
jgi:hypothetical protein